MRRVIFDLWKKIPLPLLLCRCALLLASIYRWRLLLRTFVLLFIVAMYRCHVQGLPCGWWLVMIA